MTVAINRNFILKANFFECSVALVEVHVVGGGVVADEEVDFAIVVNVDKDRAEAVVAGLVGHAGFLADIGKGAVAVVMKEMVGLALEAARATCDGLTTEGAEGVVATGLFAGGEIVPVPVDVARYE